MSWQLLCSPPTDCSTSGCSYGSSLLNACDAVILVRWARRTRLDCVREEEHPHHMHTCTPRTHPHNTHPPAPQAHTHTTPTHPHHMHMPQAHTTRAQTVSSHIWSLSRSCRRSGRTQLHLKACLCFAPVLGCLLCSSAFSSKRACLCMWMPAHERPPCHAHTGASETQPRKRSCCRPWTGRSPAS